MVRPRKSTLNHGVSVPKEPAKPVVPLKLPSLDDATPTTDGPRPAKPAEEITESAEPLRAVTTEGTPAIHSNGDILPPAVEDRKFVCNHCGTRYPHVMAPCPICGGTVTEQTV